MHVSNNKRRPSTKAITATSAHTADDAEQKGIHSATQKIKTNKQQQTAVATTTPTTSKMQ